MLQKKSSELFQEHQLSCRGSYTSRVLRNHCLASKTSNSSHQSCRQQMWPIGPSVLGLWCSSGDLVYLFYQRQTGKYPLFALVDHLWKGSPFRHVYNSVVKQDEALHLVFHQPTYQGFMVEGATLGGVSCAFLHTPTWVEDLSSQPLESCTLEPVCLWPEAVLWVSFFFYYYK